MAMFLEEDFTKAVKELEEPDTEGWDFFTESYDVKIYRQYNEASGLYSYKVYGLLSDVPVDICAQVYMDVAYRRKWDSYVNELVEISESLKKGLYWQVNFPFPMSNRDYTYMRELREFDENGKHIWAILAKGSQFESQPSRKGVIRVDDYLQSMVITSDGKVGTKAFMHYYDNPGGSIPTWLINWAAKTGVPGFLKQMQKACRNYPDYLDQLEKGQS